MAFILTSGLTQASLKSLLNLLSILPADSILPKTKYLFNKHFAKKNFTVNYYCPTCTTALDDDMKCRICEGEFCKKNPLNNQQSYFLTVNLESQLKHITEDLQLGSNLNYRDNRTKHVNSVSDIYDGKMYRDMIKNENCNLKKPYSMSDGFNSDGVPVFNSSSFSIWPILSFINELPPLMRKKNVIFSGLWFGSLKPVYAVPFSILLLQKFSICLAMVFSGS